MKVKLLPPDSRTPTCFGMHHNGFFKFFVTFNMIQNVICIGLVIYEITLTVKVLQVITVEPLNEKIKLYIRAILWAWFIVQCVTSFIMDIRLFLTANLPSVHFLRFYAWLHSISLSLFFIIYYTLIIIGGNILPYPPALANVLLPGHVLYRIYTSFVVYRYSKDIEWEVEMQSAYRNLTESEIMSFEKGFAEMETDNEKMKAKDQVYETCYEMAKFRKYRKTEFEIPIETLDFTDSTTLGCGEYGCVYKVLWLRKNEKVEVAVKTVDPELSDVNHFKALLTEAKVMTFMGKHENIVELIGICTSEIRARKLYIVCELCKFGNLLSHLRSERNTFVNMFAAPTNDLAIDVEQSTVGGLCTKDLIKWAGEIASGMEFLATKKILHGDLAARNVLLTSTKTAKITDFGLSRKLYSYSVYTKRQSMPLPWRWLACVVSTMRLSGPESVVIALESLVDMDFSSMSDVWMYGICLWEIFQLGGRPWPDVQLFCSEFIENLKDGKRMEQPKYCNKKIFEIMNSCWNTEPASRPTFSVLKDFFNDHYNQFN